MLNVLKRQDERVAAWNDVGQRRGEGGELWAKWDTVPRECMSVSFMGAHDPSGEPAPPPSDDAGGGKGRDADEGRAHPSGDVFGLSPLLRSNRFSPHVAARILDNRLCPFVPIVPCMFFSFAVF